MNATMALALALAAGLAWPAFAVEDDDARVEYMAGDGAGHADFDARARSGDGRQLREKALAKRAAYETALARRPDIAALDARLAAARTKQDGLTAERKTVAEGRSEACALQRDAWTDARDALLALRAAPGADPAALAAAQERADAAQREFRKAMERLPEVQDLDLALASARAELSDLHIQRRSAEEANAPHLAAERQTMADAEAAYLQYVYGQ